MVATTSAHRTARRCKAIASSFGCVSRWHFAMVFYLISCTVSQKLMLLQLRANDVVLHADQLAFVVSLLALPRGYDCRAIGTIRGAIGLRAQHAGMVSTRGNTSCMFRGASLLEENLLTEVRDRCSYLTLLWWIRTA